MFRLSIFLFSLFYLHAAFAEGDPDRGQLKVMACTACHGPDGNSFAGMFPSLAGLGEKYLLKQMLDIKSGARPAPLMSGTLNSLTEQDMADASAYYAGQTIKIGHAKEELLELGETIYRAGIGRKKIAACTACHGPSGTGNSLAAFPALGGQWPEYTIAQLKAFRTGTRANDGDGHMMQGVALDLSDKEIEAVASYVYGLGK